MHRVNELQDPTYQYKVDIGNFQVSHLMKISFYYVWLSYCYYYLVLLLTFGLQLNLVVCSPGREDIFSGYSGTLQPLPDFPGGPSLLGAQKHALLRFVKIPRVCF